MFTLTDTDSTATDTTGVETETNFAKTLNVVWPKYTTTDSLTYTDTNVCGASAPNGDLGVASPTNPAVTKGMTNPAYVGVNLAYQCDIVTPFKSRQYAAENLGLQSCVGDTITIGFVPGSIPAGVDNEDLMVYVFFNKPTSSYHYVSSNKDTKHILAAYGNPQLPGDPTWSNNPTFRFSVRPHHFQELPWADNSTFDTLSPRNNGMGFFAQIYTSCGTYLPPNATANPPTSGSTIGNCGGQLYYQYTRNIFPVGTFKNNTQPVCYVAQPPPSPPMPARPPPPALLPPEPPQAPAAPNPPPRPAKGPLAPPPPNTSPPPHPSSAFLQPRNVKSPANPTYPAFSPPHPPPPPSPHPPPHPPPLAPGVPHSHSCPKVVEDVCRACNGKLYTNKCNCVCPLTHIESAIVAYGLFVLILLIQCTL